MFLAGFPVAHNLICAAVAMGTISHIVWLDFRLSAVFKDWWTLLYFFA
jgi:hypothetical protein